MLREKALPLCNETHYTSTPTMKEDRSPVTIASSRGAKKARAPITDSFFSFFLLFWPSICLTFKAPSHNPDILHSSPLSSGQAGTRQAQTTGPGHAQHGAAVFSRGYPIRAGTLPHQL